MNEPQFKALMITLSDICDLVEKIAETLADHETPGPAIIDGGVLVEAPKARKPRAKKEKPAVETFPAAPAAAPELTIADLDLGAPAKKEEVKELGSAYTLTDVKNELTKLKAAKGPSAIASLFADFGLKHVNEIKPEQMSALMDATKRAQS